MTDAVISLLIQVPLVGVFVLFVVMMSRGLLQHWEKREEQEGIRRAAAMDSGLKALDAMGKMHEQALKQVCDAMRSINENLNEHDANERARWDRWDRFIDAYGHHEHKPSERR